MTAAGRPAAQVAGSGRSAHGPEEVYVGLLWVIQGHVRALKVPDVKPYPSGAPDGSRL